jgi:hypothetical protein
MLDLLLRAVINQKTNKMAREGMDKGYKNDKTIVMIDDI